MPTIRLWSALFLDRTQSGKLSVRFFVWGIVHSLLLLYKAIRCDDVGGGSDVRIMLLFRCVISPSPGGGSGNGRIPSNSDTNRQQRRSVVTSLRNATSSMRFLQLAELRSSSPSSSSSSSLPGSYVWQWKCYSRLRCRSLDPVGLDSWKLTRVVSSPSGREGVSNNW